MLGDVRLDKMTPQLIAMYRDRLLGAPCHGHANKTTRPRSEATVRNYLIELSRLFALAVKELRVMDSNPCASVVRPAASRQVVRYLSDDERAALLAACKESESVDLYPFVLLCLTTGCRKGEAAALEWPQVDLKRRWATFPRTKNGDARGVPLTGAVCALLEARKRDRGRVFEVDITKAWHTAIDRAGIVDFRFHDLRHSCASTLVQNGANLAEVATLLGHKSMQMTLRYAHVGDAGTSRLVDRVMGGIA
jgi:integrase